MPVTPGPSHAARTVRGRAIVRRAAMLVLATAALAGCATRPFGGHTDCGYADCGWPGYVGGEYGWPYPDGTYGDATPDPYASAPSAPYAYYGASGPYGPYGAYGPYYYDGWGYPWWGGYGGWGTAWIGGSVVVGSGHAHYRYGAPRLAPRSALVLGPRHGYTHALAPSIFLRPHPFPTFSSRSHGGVRLPSVPGPRKFGFVGPRRR